ncbi:CTD phosphatase Fcp1 [Cryptotrichosporon argae]
MDDPTPLPLPSDLPFPITVTRLLVSPGADVARGSRMLEYSFLSATARKDRAKAEHNGQQGGKSSEAKGNDMVGSWECPVKGTVDRWEAWVRPGTIVEQRHASKPVVRVAEPCTHPVQLHGMCGICGADLTVDDYLSRPSNSTAGPSRPAGSYELAHDAMGVTVSTNEARRLETLARDTLLSARKLSLIVDLDQTIIHTTVDPTVGEWMSEIDAESGTGADGEEQAEADSEGHEDKGAEQDEAAGEGGHAADPPARSTTPPLLPPRKEKNPNAEALKDVARFQLADDSPSGAGKGTEPVRWYYTKPRPGLAPFLQAMSHKYELHVYTMGTRTYADAICAVIDPDGSIFGGRVLSRDESGSMSSKSLIRLFPTDHSMVVVIDDRSDVWGDCPNLVKVIPYDFFVGIGDINGSFLPPQPTAPTPIDGNPSLAPQTPSSAALSPLPATPEDVLEDEGIALKRAMLDEVAEQRPLAKAQDELERGETGDGAAATRTGGEEDGLAAATGVKPQERRRKPLLNANDHELDRVGSILDAVHSDFYRAYDGRTRREMDAPLPLGCDVELIIPTLKARVLDGCVLVFSAVIPRGQRPEESEIWLAAESYGARVLHMLHPTVTHVVTNARGTEKAVAAERQGAKVVWLQWLSQCMARWERLDEAAYDASPGAEARERWEGANRPAETRDAAVDSSGGAETPTEPADPVRDPALSQEADEPAENDPHEAGDESAEAALDGWGHEWDDADDKEFEAFMKGGSDYDGDGSEWGPGEADGDNASEAGSVASAVSRAGSPPSTPRKRVRYADEESRPLESFKDPSPDAHVSPKKRPRALLLPPSDGSVQSEASGTGPNEPEGDVATIEQDNADDDADDEFAKMLAESMG